MTPVETTQRHTYEVVAGLCGGGLEEDRKGEVLEANGEGPQPVEDIYGGRK